MSIEAAAEQLKLMDEISRQKESERRRKTQQEEVTYQQWTSFRVDNERYCIDVMSVKEVLRYPDITPVPGTRSFILGILNLRGSLVTVIDTRRFFNLEPRLPDDKTRVIIVELNEQEVVGLVVDSIEDVINLPQNQIERAPSVLGEESARHYVQGVCYFESVLIILLDLNKILAQITPTSTEPVG